MPRPTPSTRQSTPTSQRRSDPIVAEPPREEDRLGPRAKRFLPFSGKSEGAQQELAGRFLAWLDERTAPEFLLADMAWTAGIGRSHFSHRAGLVFHDAESLRDGLRALANGELEGTGPRAGTKVAFAYTGQASQWPGMGQALYASEPVVRAALDRCDEALRDYGRASLVDVMFGRSGWPAIWWSGPLGPDRWLEMI